MGFNKKEERIMPIHPIHNTDNRNQNNIMAASAGICTGTAGAIAGYNFAPRAAKNMEELLTSNQDVFCRTIDNMQNANSIDAFAKSWSLIPARASLDSLEIRINNAFPGDKISANDFKSQLNAQQIKVKDASKKIDDFLTDIAKKKGTNISLEQYYNELKKRDFLPENLINMAKESIVDTIGEEAFKAPNPINDDTIDILKSCKEIALNISNKELELYKNLARVEKNGVLLKKDMLESANKDIKPIIDEMLSGTPFEDIKKFIPKTGRTKWAVITGVASAFVAAACVKIFGNKE